MRTIYPRIEPEVAAYYAMAYTSAVPPTIDQFTLNEQIKAIKRGSTVSLGTVSLNLSLPAGGPIFISNPKIGGVITDLRPYSGFLATIVEGVGGADHTLTETLGAVGTGETLSGTELVTNGNMENLAGWSQDIGTWLSVAGGQVGNCAQGTAAASILQLARGITTTVGALYKFTAYEKQGTGGALTYRVGFTNYGVAWLQSIQGMLSVAWTQHAVYWTADRTNPYVQTNTLTSGTGTALFDEVSTQQVLTPSATGIWATVGTEGGLFNRQPASVTVTITKP